jgi:hypothetical protein
MALQEKYVIGLCFREESKNPYEKSCFQIYITAQALMFVPASTFIHHFPIFSHFFNPYLYIFIWFCGIHNLLFIVHFQNILVSISNG